MFRLTIDDTDYLDPSNWSEVSVRYAWDDKIFLASSSPSYEFTGAAYTYIVGQYETGLCGSLDVRIYLREGPAEILVHSGKIYLPEITIDRFTKTVAATISDDSYSAWIRNKRKQKYVINAPFDYAGGAVTAAASSNITFHVPSTGVYTVNRKGYTVYEAFTFLVSALSEGNMAFASTLMAPGGEWGELSIFLGEEIRTGLTDQGPDISFDQLFTDLDRGGNLGAWIEEIAGVPTLRIERWSYFFDNEVAVRFNDVRVTESADVDRLYTRVTMGSREAREFDDDTPNTQFPNARFVGWFEEDYNTVGECSVENELDLTWQTLIVDSNAIENAFVGGNDDNDDAVFLVEVSQSNTVASDFLGTGDFFYNPSFTNYKVIQQWEGAVPLSIAKFLGDGNDEFEAETNGDETGTTSLNLNPVEYDNEISDPNGNYDAVTNYEYTAPAQGEYVMRVTSILEFVFVDITQARAAYEVRWMVDRGAGYVNEATDAVEVNTPLETVISTRSFFLDTADLVRVQIDIAQAGGGPATLFYNVTLKEESSFECTVAANGGGVYATFDPDDVRLLLYEAEIPIGCEPREVWAADRRRAVVLSQTIHGVQSDFKGHIKEMSWQATGVSTVTLWSGRNAIFTDDTEDYADADYSIDYD